MASKACKWWFLLLLVILMGIFAVTAGAVNNPYVGQAIHDASLVAAQSLCNGRHIDIRQIWCACPSQTFNGTWLSFVQEADTNGSTVHLSLQPEGADCLTQINNGSMDSYFTTFAQQVAAYNKLIYIRPMQESNEPNFGWGQQPAAFKSAFQRISNIFRNNAPKAKIEWNVGDWNNPGYTFSDFNPGTAYYDYAGIDGYNWGTSHPEWPSHWATFSDVFTSAYNYMSTLGKPILVSEYGCTNSGGDKNAWIVDAFNQIRNGSFQQIIMMLYYDVTGGPEYFDIDSGGRTGYNQAINFPTPTSGGGTTPTPTASPTASPTATPTPTTSPGNYDDEFTSGALASKWSWVRQNSANWSLTARSGYMRIIVEDGDLNHSPADNKNTLIQTAPSGDWSIVAKLDGKPAANWVQAGIIVYQDDDNYLKLVRLYSDGNLFQFVKEVGGTFTYSTATDSIASTVSYLKITKSGTNYSGYYSPDNSTWTQVWTAQSVSLSNIKIGLVAFNGSGTNTMNAGFDWFHVPSGSGPTPTPTLTPTPTSTATATSGSGNTHSGAWSCKMNNGTSWADYVRQSPVTIVANQAYVATIWAKSVSGSSSIRLGAIKGDWSGDFAAQNFNLTSSWAQYSISFNTGSYTSAIFNVQTNCSGCVYYLDDAFLGVSGGANKLSNPGFESGSTSWETTGAFSILQP